ncbi:uncharacterized protein C3orf85 homolog [Kogia breviceps]|uniref:uncharacterized protein C3orf85 homolog n=1 Tax=Kogia breviceps TaxID=27615 RepID=UPI0034D30E00
MRVSTTRHIGNGNVNKAEVPELKVQFRSVLLTDSLIKSWGFSGKKIENASLFDLKKVLSMLTFLTTVSDLGALGAPFLLEDPSNQFLHLKRHIYLQDYWNPDHSPNTWGNTLADQAHETWTALKTTAQYYLNVNTFTLDMSTAQ